MAINKIATIPDAMPEVTKINASGVPVTADVISRATVNSAGSIGRLDLSWVSSAFLISPKDLGKEEYRHNLYFSSARYKFTDTRPGGNLGINSKYQFTRYSDIRSSGRLFGRNEVTTRSITGNYGMGRYYSEAIDDPEQTIYLEFGVAKFASALHFLTSAFDSNSAYTANTGRSNLFGKLGTILGAITIVSAFPVMSIALWTAGVGSRLLPGASSQYYTVKPTMHLYWSMVNGLLTDMAVNLGVFPAGLAPLGKNPQKYGTELKLNNSQYQLLSNIFPDIFTSKHHIDVFAIANRAQVLAQQQANEEYKRYVKGSSKNLNNYFKAYGQDKIKKPPGNHGYSNYINQLLSFSNKYKRDYGRLTTATINPKDKKIKSTVTTDMDTSLLSTVGEVITDSKEWISKFKKDIIQVSKSYLEDTGKYFDATVRDGSAFAIFKVEYTGTTTNSFSNSVKTAGINSVLNSTSRNVKNVKFNAFGGNILGDVISTVTDSVMQFVKGYASQVTFGLTNVISGLLGGGYIDVPKQWDDSSVSLNRSTYKMKLISPYGNVISSLLDLYLPLSMILSGTVPIATGKTSYTSPFLCKLYDRGRQQTTTGIIDSLTITAGESNLGFTLDGRPLAFDISFSVLDLTSIMAMPISDNNVFGINLHLDDDHMLPRYIATITGRDLYSQRYLTPNAMYKLALVKGELDSFTAARTGSWLGSSTVGNMLSLLGTAGNQIIPR